MTTCPCTPACHCGGSCPCHRAPVHRSVWDTSTGMPEIDRTLKAELAGNIIDLESIRAFIHPAGIPTTAQNPTTERHPMNTDPEILAIIETNLREQLATAQHRARTAEVEVSVERQCHEAEEALLEGKVHKAISERQQARSIAVRLEQENAHLVEQLDEYLHAEQAARRAPVSVERGAITIPAPHVAYGPKGIPERTADADYLREAAQHIEGGYPVGGSNLTATVLKLLRDVADALSTQQVHNHGAEEGEGLACPEQRMPDGQLKGECLAPAVVHACPTANSHGTTPCCGRTPFELPRSSRMTVNPGLVTCNREGGE